MGFKFLTYINEQIKHPATIMAIGLCCHFLGNEFARAASTSLLASKDFGFGSEALSYTVVIGSPISALVLYLYTNSIKSRGPYFTLLWSNIACVLFFSYITFIMPTLPIGIFRSFIILLYYSFREIYVTLLSTQQWSFIATVLNKSKSSYMVQYSGLISIASAVGGLLVEHIVKYGGVQFLLLMALSASFLSWIFDEIAYKMVNDNNSAPTKALLQRAELKQSQINKHNNKRNFWLAAGELIFNHETLRILFFEALIHQLCGNMLNITFYDGLRKSIPESSVRAVVVGRFFAAVNTIACLLQCFVLPHLLSHQTLPNFLVTIPILVIVSIILSCFDRTDLFLQDTIAFGTVKVLEYSIMTSATEMIYMPLDCEVRYIGKEFIRFFGHRLGKSAASIILCTLNSRYQWSHLTQSFFALIFAGIWEITMFGLASHIIVTTEKSVPPTPMNMTVTITKPITIVQQQQQGHMESPRTHSQSYPIKAFTFMLPWSRNQSPTNSDQSDSKQAMNRQFFSHPVTPANRFDPQTLSTSRSASFLPDIFQWSNLSSSISSLNLTHLVSSSNSLKRNENVIVSSLSSSLPSSSSSRSSSYQSIDSSCNPVVQSLNNSNLNSIEDEDVGLSLLSHDDEDVTEDWSSRPLHHPYPLNTIISLKDLSKSIKGSISPTYHQLQNGNGSDDIAYGNAKDALVNSNNSNNNNGLRRRRQGSQEAMSELPSIDTNKGLYEDRPPNRRQ